MTHRRRLQRITPLVSRRGCAVLMLILPGSLALGSCTNTPSDPDSSPATHQDPAMTHLHHSIDYIELAVSDMAEARRFYGEAFGWKFNDYGPDYSGIQRPAGGEVGGLRLDARVEPGASLVVLYSVDLEASRKAVQAAGGRIVQDIFAFPGGRRFQFADPGGNELAVYSDK